MAFNFRGQSDVFDNGSSGDNSKDSMFDIENPKSSELSIQHPRSNVHQDNDSHGLLIEQPFKVGSSRSCGSCKRRICLYYLQGTQGIEHSSTKDYGLFFVKESGLCRAVMEMIELFMPNSQRKNRYTRS